MKIYELAGRPDPDQPADGPRATSNDQVYKTKDGKWTRGGQGDRGAPRSGPAGAGRHDLGRGLRAALRPADQAQGITHTVLNAKPEYAEREGEIDRRGGRARRGHDRHQHGRPRRRHQARRQRRAPGHARAGQARPAARDARLRGAPAPRCCPTIEERVEAQREQVMEAGGLFILGTERHESRRIDNQLRGRAGRQGDPGESRLLPVGPGRPRAPVRRRADLQDPRPARVRRRGGQRGADRGRDALQADREGAEARSRSSTSSMRKHTLEYDDVLNQQREVIYTYRDEVLEGRDMSDAAREEIANLIERLVEEYTRRRLRRGLGHRGPDAPDRGDLHPVRRAARLSIPAGSTARTSRSASRRRRWPSTTSREEELGEELMRDVERFLLLQIIDQRWRSTSTTWTTCSRASTCAGSPRSSRWSRTRTRRYELFRDLMNSDLGRLRPDHLPRRGHRPRTRTAAAPAAAAAAARARRSQLGHRRRPGQLLRRRVAAQARWRWPRRGRPMQRRRVRGRRGRRALTPRRAAARRRDRADRPQRPVLVRLGQEVQEVPRRLSGAGVWRSREHQPLAYARSPLALGVTGT